MKNSKISNGRNASKKVGNHWSNLSFEVSLRCLSSQYVWEFKQIKNLYLRIVAPRNLFIEFIHEVRSATRLPIERTRKSLLKIFESCLIKWSSPDRAEELIVVFNHNVINLYFTANISTMYVYELL